MRHLSLWAFAGVFFATACGPSARTTQNQSDAGGPLPDLSAGPHDAAMNGCAENQNCYTVYAHGDHTLYHVDLANKSLVLVGPFHAPMVVGANGKMAEDVITDLAVANDNTIYVISKTNLYTADPSDGHVTLYGPVTTCGSDNVALTFTPDGSLYAADYKGAFCKIDTSTKPPNVTNVGSLGNNLAIAGDIVAVSDGTMFGTAYTIGNLPSEKNNVLVKIDPSSGKVKVTIGATGYPKLYGVAFQNGQVFGFTHDGTGTVVTVDPKTGKGTVYNTFNDPTTGMPISFAGAGVNSMVMGPPIM